MSRIPKNLVIVAALTALVSTAACGQKSPVVNFRQAASTSSSSASNGIVVSGKGEVSGAPDTVSVSMGVSVKRATAPAAIADAASSATALINALKTAGVAEKDIQTINYSMNQEFRYPSNGTPVPDGFRVSNSVIAKVRKMDNVGAVIDAATNAAGANAIVEGISFSLDDDAAALSNARAEAFADAKKKATQFADLSGRKLGQVESIKQTVTTTPPPSMSFAADSVQRSAAPTPIQPGEVVTAVTVDVRWSFGD